jgi:hypothetical protein
MRGMIRLTSAAVSGLTLLGMSAISSAQGAGPSPQLVGRMASVVAPGFIQGVVSDDKGSPIADVMVSALGAITALAVTDVKGRFELRALPPGPYFVGAHLGGYTAPRPQLVEVRSNGRTASAIALRRADVTPILAAGVGAFGTTASQGADSTHPPDTAERDAGKTTADPSETAWRLRHTRRGVLKDVTIPTDLFAGGSPANVFAATPFSGQVNFLTTGTFETPRDLFSPNGMSHGIANVSLTAPAGSNADWTVRGAMTQADISSWIVAGSYRTRDTARHQHGLGLSYSTQRYDGGNPLALREVTDGSRNAGEISGFDTLRLTPTTSLTYGGRYAQYDYLEARNLVSPHVELVLTPFENVRIRGSVSRGALAPGAEEFLAPRDNTGIWLPPQRTFSALEPGRALEAERTLHANIGFERNFHGSTLGLRAFHQLVSDQLMTLFGAEMPDQPSAKIGHYFVGSAGDAKATGGAASFGTSLAGRVHGSVEYSLANARLRPDADLRHVVLMASSAVRPRAERIHDVAATIEASVPETATHVLVLYRVGNAFAHGSETPSGGTATRRALDSRFDVQVRQSLPFMAFGTARWEMLLAVRNFFHESSPEQSIYDELLVVRPPKRIVGGITMLF